MEAEGKLTDGGLSAPGDSPDAAPSQPATPPPAIPSATWCQRRRPPV